MLLRQVEFTTLMVNLSTDTFSKFVSALRHTAGIKLAVFSGLKTPYTSVPFAFDACASVQAWEASCPLEIEFISIFGEENDAQTGKSQPTTTASPGTQEFAITLRVLVFEIFTVFFVVRESVPVFLTSDTCE